MQDRNAAFVNGTVDRKTVSPDHLQNSVSRYVVPAGSLIPTALITPPSPCSNHCNLTRLHWLNPTL
jgi:type IV secretory pathway VirB10-like protein